jgi:hypothetical protein
MRTRERRLYMSPPRTCLLPGVYCADGRPPRTLLVVVGQRCIYTEHDVTPFLECEKEDHQPEAQRPGVIPVSTCMTNGFRRAVGQNPARTFTLTESFYLASRIFPLRSNRRRNRFERTVFTKVAENQDVLPAFVPHPAVDTRPRPELPKPSVQGWLTQTLQKLRRRIKLPPAKTIPVSGLESSSP